MTCLSVFFSTLRENFQNSETWKDCCVLTEIWGWTSHVLRSPALCMDWTVVASNFTGLVNRLVIHDWWEKSQFSSAVSLQLHIGMVCLCLSAHRKYSTHITRHHMRLCHDNQVMWPHGTCYIKVCLSHDRISDHLYSVVFWSLELISDSTCWNFFSNI